MNMVNKRKRSLSILGDKEITLQGQKVSYLLKQSPRIRGIRLEIRPDSGLAVIVPRKYSNEYLSKLLVQKSKWILRHLPGFKPVQMPLFRKEVDRGDKIPFMGRQIQIVQIQAHGKKPSVFLKDTKLIMEFNMARYDMAILLEDWYRMQAKVIFTGKADIFKQKIGVKYRGILIRGQRTRWGSCSRLRNLTLNWKLLMAPETVIDYVIIHELAHIKHMDHSRKFWETVAKFCPKYKEYKKWLITHEDELKARAAFQL